MRTGWHREGGPGGSQCARRARLRGAGRLNPGFTDISCLENFSENQCVEALGGVTPMSKLVLFAKNLNQGRASQTTTFGLFSSSWTDFVKPTLPTSRVPSYPVPGAQVRPQRRRSRRGACGRWRQ